ncbi:asparagine synthase-related protein [Desulfobacter postgatei]|uniref:asparagine synthase-related protein n=1 Tax=Desulfobacter postgatei TaxID=2293 RepID=UPI00259BF162|nr:asparagine synthase-related protein [uncultured Desulfobacter sp.]
MQGIVGCYIKNKEKAPFLSRQILNNMLSALKENVRINIERIDYLCFSSAVLFFDHTPDAFKAVRISHDDQDILVDGFFKNRDNISLFNSKTKVNFLSFIEHSGIFNGVCFCHTTNEMTLLNDRHGAKYLYYYENDDLFLFAPNPKVILSSGIVTNKDIDYKSVISLLSQEFIMGDRSILESIKLLPGASCIKLKNNHKQVNRYWNFEPLTKQKQDGCYSDLVDEGTRLIKDAIESYAFKKETIIIPLSGGLDSRTISCFLAGKTKSRAIHIDYGFEKKYAKRIAQALGIPLNIYPLESYQPWQAIDSEILCASQSIHQFWIYPFLKKEIERNSGTIVVDGYLMNEVIGGLSTINRSDYSDINKIYPPLNKAFDFILGPKIKSNFYSSYNSQVLDIVENCPSKDEYHKYLYFVVLNYGRRFTLLFSVVHQYLCSVGLPILDYDLMDFCLALPFEAKVNSRFYRDVVSRSFPQIAPIPWSRNRLPLNSPKKKHTICHLQKEWDKIKHYLTRLTNSKIETLPVHDKNRRFRKDKNYRNYFMDIIFDEQTFDRDYVSKSGLEKLVQLIDTGRNYFGILEKVALIEMLAREFQHS